MGHIRVTASSIALPRRSNHRHKKTRVQSQRRQETLAHKIIEQPRVTKERIGHAVPMARHLGDVRDREAKKNGRMV